MNRKIFNIDSSVVVECDVHAGNEIRNVVVIKPNGVDVSITDILGFNRAINVVGAIGFILKSNEKVVSAETICGVTVYRGNISKKALTQ